MQLAEGLDALQWWRALPVLALGWLAIFFGRTLRAGETPLIERIARVRDPGLAPSLCRYTRRLTRIWTVYFVVAAVFVAAWPAPWPGALVAAGALLLFVGEHCLRPLLFPGKSFPNLLQQVIDTASVWRRGS
jgi:uncharacterized membrane protein